MVLTYLNQRTSPRTIKIADAEKINGHNLYGRKFTLKPVNKEITDIVKSITTESK